MDACKYARMDGRTVGWMERAMTAHLERLKVAGRLVVAPQLRDLRSCPAYHGQLAMSSGTIALTRGFPIKGSLPNHPFDPSTSRGNVKARVLRSLGTDVAFQIL